MPLSLLEGGVSTLTIGVPTPYLQEYTTEPENQVSPQPDWLAIYQHRERSPASPAYQLPATVSPKESLLTN